HRNGVGIFNADGNQLIGSTDLSQPFLYYNVLSGNSGNGLRIVNSKNTTVQSNFMGVGANNASLVPNRRLGLDAVGDCTGSVVQGNKIAGNSLGDVNITHASGVTYLP